jgi:hypothetical protein
MHLFDSKKGLLRPKYYGVKSFTITKTYLADTVDVPQLNRRFFYPTRPPTARPSRNDA